MTYQFKQLDKQVTIQTQWNTRYLYLRDDGDWDRISSAASLLRVRLYQRTVSLRERAYSLRSAVQTVIYAPLAIWLNVSRPVRSWWRGVRAGVRHYVVLTRAIKHYNIG